MGETDDNSFSLYSPEPQTPWLPPPPLRGLVSPPPSPDFSPPTPPHVAGQPLLVSLSPLIPLGSSAPDALTLPSTFPLSGIKSSIKLWNLSVLDHIQLLSRWKNQAIVSMVFHTEAYLFNSCSNVIVDSLTHKDLGFLIPFRTNPKSSSGIKALGICPCLPAPPSLPPHTLCIRGPALPGAGPQAVLSLK